MRKFLNRLKQTYRFFKHPEKYQETIINYCKVINPMEIFVIREKLSKSCFELDVVKSQDWLKAKTEEELKFRIAQAVTPYIKVSSLTNSEGITFYGELKVIK